MGRIRGTGTRCPASAFLIGELDDMLPETSSDNGSDMRCVYAEPEREHPAALTISARSSNSPHLLFCKSSAPAHTPEGATAPRLHVCTVLCRRAQVEMRWIHARRVV